MGAYVLRTETDNHVFGDISEEKTSFSGSYRELELHDGYIVLYSTVLFHRARKKSPTPSIMHRLSHNERSTGPRKPPSSREKNAG